MVKLEVGKAYRCENGKRAVIRERPSFVSAKSFVGMLYGDIDGEDYGRWWFADGSRFPGDVQSYRIVAVWSDTNDPCAIET